MKYLKEYLNESKPLVITVRILTLAIFVTLIVFNARADNATISNKYPTFLTPPGFAFAIWGLIYLFLAVFVLYQLFPRTYSGTDTADKINNGVSLWLIGNFILNILWIFAFEKEQLTLALIFLTAIAGTLVPIWYYFANEPIEKQQSVLDFFCIKFGIYLYLGWTTAAAALNAFVASTDMSEKYLFQSVCGAIIVAGIEAFWSLYAQNGTMAAVGCWALVTIGTKNISAGFGSVGYTSLVLGILLGVLAVGLFALSGYKYIQLRKSKETSNMVHSTPATEDRPEHPSH